MIGFLKDLSPYETIFFVISASSTIILIIQTVLALVGMTGHGDSDLGDSHIVGDATDGDVDVGVGVDAGDIDVDAGVDVHIDAHVDPVAEVHIAHDHSSMDTDNTSDHSSAHQYDVHGLRLFTVRGVMAFLMIGGWVGFLMLRALIHPVVSTVCAIISGFISLYFMARIMQILMNMQEDGTVKINNALGQIGQVYIRIPAEEKGMGKVNVTVQEKLCEFDAVTEKSEMIKTGAMVYVTDVRAGNVLVVEKVEEE